MAASVVSSSLVLKPTLTLPRPQTKSLPSISRSSYPLKVEARQRKIKTDTPYEGIGPACLLLIILHSRGLIIECSAGPTGGMTFADGVDASGRKAKGKGVYQFVDKYGANVDGYSPIYSPNEWSPSGDVYVGGTTGLLIWAVTLVGLLGGGALLVYNTSALSQ